MPQYSYLSRTRDVFGEVGWIPNFEQKRSKFNETRHPTYREFFDNPRDDYHNEYFTSTSLTDCCDGSVKNQTLTNLESKKVKLSPRSLHGVSYEPIENLSSPEF